MTRMLGLLLGLLIGGGAAAQTSSVPIGPGGTAPGAATFVATGGTAAQSAAARAGQSLFVTDFGAKCDGVSDDTAAINAATAALRAAPNIQGTLNFPASGKCMVSGPLNFTGLASLYNTIQGNGAVIHGTYASSGPAGTLGTIAGGSSYTAGTYGNVPLTGGSGSSCTAASITVAGGAVTAVVLPSGGCGGNYSVGDTLSASAANIGGTGAGFSVPVASVSGGAIIDASGSRFVRWEHFTIEGDCTTTPNLGLQLTRTSGAGYGDSHVFDDVYVTGCFGLAAVLNNNSETDQFNHLIAWNQKPAGTVYGLIMDGSNHWNASSSFVGITAGVDTAGSFNENTFISLDARVTTSAGGIAVWINQAGRHRFVGGYTAASRYCAVLYSTATTSISQLYWDVHCETGSVTDVFFVTGPQANPVFNGLTYLDNGTFATNSVFKADANVSSVTMFNADIEIAYYFTQTAKVFDNPALWAVGGVYASPNIAQWNAPATFQGQLRIGAGATLAYYGGAALTAQAPDNGVTGGNARGANAVDLQTTRTGAPQVASGVASMIGGGSANTATATYSSVTGGYANYASGQGASVYGGQGNTSSGVASSTRGLNATDRARYDVFCSGDGAWSANGDRQMCDAPLYGRTTNTSAIRLTGDGAAAGAANCVNLTAAGQLYALRIDIVALDRTTPTNSSTWGNWTGEIDRSGATATTHLAMNATPTPLSTGAVAGVAVAAAADTANGCLSLTFTPPTSNADTWDIVARVTTTEVQ